MPAQMAQEKAQRDEERRRQTETEEIVRNAETEKQNALAEAAAACYCIKGDRSGGHRIR